MRSRVLGEKVREAHEGSISVFGFEFELCVRVLGTQRLGFEPQDDMIRVANPLRCLEAYAGTPTVQISCPAVAKDVLKLAE